MKIATRASFLLLLASSSFLLAIGCSRPPQTRSVKVSSTRAADDSVMPMVRDLLRNGANAGDWRNYVQQVNRYLREHPNAQPRPLSNEERAFLAKEVHLDQGELAELENSTFTPLDAHYLELAFVLRDTVRALQIDGLRPLDRVRRAFAWVVRQVRLQEGEAIPVPPLAVLRRGWGSSRERALVFLALLDQLGIDGCMITIPAEAQAEQGAQTHSGSQNQGTQAHPSPGFPWVPGARIDNEIYLFDTRLGLPLPGPDGTQIATLAQVWAGLDLRQILSSAGERGNGPRSPAELKPLHQYPYDVGPEKSRHAEVLVAYSLSSLAPRMQFLQDYLAGSEKVNLWVDPVARFQRFQAAAGTVGVWNPPKDANNPLRVLRAFLPQEEGGVAQQLFREMVQQQEIPWPYFPPPLRAMPGKPGEQLRSLFAAPFVYFSLETRMPPERLVAWLPGLSQESADKPGRRKLSESLLRSSLPRDLLLHGRFDEAVTLLVAMEQELRRQKARPADPHLDAKVRDWCEKALAAYSDLFRAEQEAGSTGGKDAASIGPVATARERIYQLWGPESEPVSEILQRSMADPMLERVVYLLALCKQEQAEAKTGADAWRSASSWWKTYLREHGSAPAAPSARLLRAWALQALGDRQEAVALLEDLSGVSTDLEKTARLYQAKRLKKP